MSLSGASFPKSGSTAFLSLRPTAPQVSLSIPSPYIGTDSQVTEPSTVYIAGGWHGYTRWMAYSPYPNADANFENPSICASNDGQTWVTPNGLTNPIVAKPASGTNSDPSIMLSPDGTKLYVVFNQLINGTTQYIMLTESSDGLTWSAATSLYSEAIAGSRVSMPNMWFDGTQYVLMGQDIAQTNNPTVRMVNGGTNPYSGWPASATNVTMRHPSGGTWWHGTFVKHGTGHIYCLMQDGGNGGGNLYVGESSDNGLTWTMRLFDSAGGYYRSCFHIVPIPGVRDAVEIIYGRISGGFTMRYGPASLGI